MIEGAVDSLTRRRLLAAGALAAWAMWRGRPAVARGARVLVVGAGLSGLYAARLLEQFGFEAIVVEARERVGGRVLTLDTIAGRPEAGGNLIGANYGRLLAVAAQSGVEMRSADAVETLPTAYLIDGEPASARSWRDSTSNPLPDGLKTVTPDRLGAFLLRDHPVRNAADWCNGTLAHLDVAARNFFLGRGLDAVAIALLGANNGYGNTLAETSLLSLYRTVAGIERAIAFGRPTLEAVAGNQRVPEAMAAELARPVVAGDPVIVLERGADGVAAACRSGRRLEADAAIVTIPLPALRQIEFRPTLPRVQREAIDSIRYLKLTQAHLVADRADWTASGLPGSLWSNAPFGRLFVRRSPGSDTYNITVWINGDSCDRYDALPDREAGTRILEDLFDAYPDARDRLRLRAFVRWHLDPWSRGSWAVWAPGQIGRHFAALHEPAGTIHFAGEHTAYAYSGMEGAMESAERAVLEVLRTLS